MQPNKTYVGRYSRSRLLPDYNVLVVQVNTKEVKENGKVPS